MRRLNPSYKTLYKPLPARLVHPFLDIVFPPRSLLAPNIDSQQVNGWSDLTFLDMPCCHICGYPFEFDEGEAVMCGACAAHRPVYNQARAALSYDEHSRVFILAFKHGGRTEHLSFFAAQMVRTGRSFWQDADFLVPVPLHSGRLMRRRFNQAAILARAVSKQTGTPYQTSALLRRRATASQGHLSPAQRRKNVSGAFIVPELRRAAIKDRHLVLIDDVMTTGATLDSCAKTLLKAGAAKVSAVTLARIVRARPLPL